MAQFADRCGRTWSLELNLALAKRIKRVAGLDFLNVHDGKALSAISQDDEKLGQVLWLLVEEQAQAQSIDEEGFGRGLSGDALGEAIEALLEAIELFSPPARRPVIRSILTKAKEASQAETKLVLTKLSSPKVQEILQAKAAQKGRQIDRELEKILATCGDSSASGPAS